MQISSRRLGLVLSLTFCFSLALQAQYDERGERPGRDDDRRFSGEYGPARSLVGRVQNQLRRTERFSQPEGKERERIQNAQRHLSEFDRKLSRGEFDKDKLDEAIDDVKNVLDHNTLPPEGRDDLSRSLEDPAPHAFRPGPPVNLCRGGRARAGAQ